MRSFNAIVLGLGAMGSAALWHLAARGRRVLGIDRFGVAHDRGSAHGKTRIIRRAYFEHPDYVPLVADACRLWSELEAAAGKKLFYRTGLLMIGLPAGDLIPGVKRAAAAHRLDIAALSLDEVRTRVPALQPADDMEAMFEPDAGLLLVEECVRAHVEQAVARGAQLALHEPVRSWTATDAGVEVVTGAGRYAADHLVLCPGPWAGQLVKELNLPLDVRRKVMMWFRPAAGGFHLSDGLPVFCFDTAAGFFYGFPALDDDGVKVAEHTGGTPVPDPDAAGRALHEADLAPVRTFIRSHVRGLEVTPRRHAVCFYTMTPDRHCILDRHPLHPRVVFAAGFSGHGFKFAPVIGSILADLILTGTTPAPARFLSLERFRPTD